MATSTIGRLDEDFMKWVDERIAKNERVYNIQPKCPECGTQQVQILDVDTQEWWCRHCQHRFTTEVELYDQG